MKRIFISILLLLTVIACGKDSKKENIQATNKKEVVVAQKKVEKEHHSNTDIKKEKVLVDSVKKTNFNSEVFSAPSKSFSNFVGKWHIDKDGKNLVFAVDGRKWEQGLMAKGVAQKAKAMYGKKYAKFLDNLQAYKYFPLSIYKNIKEFKDGEIKVNFKAISGRIDQGAGIAFNIKPNGDYLVIRANPLEENIVLFKMEKGHRSSVQWTKNIPHKSHKWYTLKVVIKENHVYGYLNDKKCIDYKHKSKLEGKIGLWSKADSYVFFDDFIVKSE